MNVRDLPQSQPSSWRLAREGHVSIRTHFSNALNEYLGIAAILPFIRPEGHMSDYPGGLNGSTQH
jgi:hypothetical protein